MVLEGPQGSCSKLVASESFELGPRKELVRFDSFRFRTFEQHIGLVRFGLVRKNIFQVRCASACVFRTRRGSVRFGSVRFHVRFRPVPEFNGSVRPVGLGFLFLLALLAQAGVPGCLWTVAAVYKGTAQKQKGQDRGEGHGALRSPGWEGAAGGGGAAQCREVRTKGETGKGERSTCSEKGEVLLGGSVVPITCISMTIMTSHHDQSLGLPGTADVHSMRLRSRAGRVVAAMRARGLGCRVEGLGFRMSALSARGRPRRWQEGSQRRGDEARGILWVGQAAGRSAAWA